MSKLFLIVDIIKSIDLAIWDWYSSMYNTIDCYQQYILEYKKVYKRGWSWRLKRIMVYITPFGYNYIVVS